VNTTNVSHSTLNLALLQLVGSSGSTEGIQVAPFSHTPLCFCDKLLQWPVLRTAVIDRCACILAGPATKFTPTSKLKPEKTRGPTIFRN
jgi:hypothetical protein